MPEPELDRLSSILQAFNDQFGTLFDDADRVTKRIRDDINDLRLEIVQLMIVIVDGFGLREMRGRVQHRRNCFDCALLQLSDRIPQISRDLSVRHRCNCICW